MAAVELSFWAKVALGGVAWTVVSLAFALFLGRLLREASGESEDAGAVEGEIDTPRAPRLVEPDTVLGASFAGLPEAEIAYGEDGNRESGTRYRPVMDEPDAQPRRHLRSIG